jgi:hypothetical protein
MVVLGLSVFDFERIAIYKVSGVPKKIVDEIPERIKYTYNFYLEAKYVFLTM